MPRDLGDTSLGHTTQSKLAVQALALWERGSRHMRRPWRNVGSAHPCALPRVWGHFRGVCYSAEKEIEMAEIKFDIKETIGVLSESTKGWSKELNLVSWNDATPKYDIREWSPDHTKMGKSITLTAEELNKLSGLLGGLNL